MADFLSNSNRAGAGGGKPLATTRCGRRVPLGVASVIVWLVVLVPPILLLLDFGRWPIYFGAGLASNLLLSYSAVRWNCSWFGPVITRFRPSQKEVWLTIDDGPDPQHTPQILDLLKQNHARATFFVIGRRVRLYPELARAILRDGHQLANHSETHPVATFWCSTASRLARELDQGTRAVLETTGQSTRLFRAPAGMANPLLHLLLRDRGMKLIGWSARGYDGLRVNPKRIVANIFRSVHPGAIILLHEGKLDRRGNQVSLAVIEALLDRLIAEGYKCVVPAEDSYVEDQRKRIS